jgi:autotransporter-associated beta strand protein
MIYAGSGTASTVSVPMSTNLGMVKIGSGTLVLSANNPSLTGGIVVSAGVLSATSSAALGPGGPGNDLLVAAGAELDLQNNITLPAVEVSISGTGVANAGALHSISGTNSLAGVLNITNNLQIATDSGSLILGQIQGSHNVTKTGSGTMALTADSSSLFSGALVVMAGILDVSNSGALGIVGGGGGLTIGNSASMTLHNNTNLPAIPITLGGFGLGGGGVLQNLQDDNSMASSLSLSSSAQIAINAGSLTLLGPISGNANCSLTKTGSGTLVLANGANSFSGPLTIAAGMLSISTMNNAGAAGPLGLSASPVALGSSGGTATFDYNGFGDSSTRPFSIATASAGIFQVDYPGVNLTLSGSISGGGSLVKAGYGTLTINGTAGYSGSTTVTQGILAIAPGGSLNNTSSITLCPGTLLQLTTSGSSQLSSSASISLQAAGLTFCDNGLTTNSGQIAGNLLLGAGDNEITATCLTGTNQPWIRFNSFPASPTTGSTVNFSASNAQVQFSTSAGLTNGILGGYAYVNGTDFATLSGGTLHAYSSYVPGDLGSIATSATTNAEPSGTQTNVSAAKTLNALNLTGVTGVQMTGTGALTLVSGGLIANTSGGIRGGILKGLASGELTINTVQDIVISSTIPDNGGPTALVKTGPGTLTLSGTISYTGQTFLNNGTLVYIPPVNTAYAGAIHGFGNLTKSGTATLTLSAANDYSGATTVTGGGLCVNGVLSPESAVTLQSTALLSGGGTVGGNVTASGGTIAMQSSAEILGSITISSGTLTIGKPGTGNYLSTIGGLYVTEGGALLVSPSATIFGSVSLSTSANSSFSGVIAGSGSVLTLDGAPGTTLMLGSTASSTFGGTIIEGGMLTIANSSALGGNSLTVNGGTLDLSGLAAVGVTTLAGSGGVIETSSGTSTLVVDPPGGPATNFAGSLLNGSGVVRLLMEGSGTLILSGSNTYSGGTTVTAGILEFENRAALPSGSSLTVGSGASLLFDSAFSLSAAASIPDSQAATVAPVPEPGTLVLLLAALCSAAIYRSFFRRSGGVSLAQSSRHTPCAVRPAVSAAGSFQVENVRSHRIGA